MNPPPLLSWILSPRKDRGLRFLQDSGGWEFFSFETLCNRSQGIASRIADSNVGAGDVVCVFLPTCPELFSAIYGTWIAGGSICLIVPPMMFENEETYVAHTSAIVSSAAPKAVVTTPQFGNLVGRILRSAGQLQATVINAEDWSGVPITPNLAAEVALLQFTSGSSGTPRGVRVTVANLRYNIEAIRQWIRMGADDVTATWLPLHHDMGLIGCLLTPTTNQSNVWIMRPDQFVRDPMRWLECFGRNDASLCAAPNFGYAYAARKVDPDLLTGMDFSSWRVAIAGAEPVDAQALTMFSELLRPFGFSTRAFLPAYGLAEATLAVAGGDPSTPPLAAHLDWGSLSFGEPVSIFSTNYLGNLACSRSAGWLVSSGKPHPGTSVTIVDDSGNGLPTDSLGEIFIAGPSVASGYSGNRDHGATKFTPEGVLTGDAGFIHDGELFVVGRMADSMKIRGRTIYADDLEIRLADGTGVSRGRLVVITVPGDQGGSVLSIGEQADQAWAIQAAQLLKGILGREISVKVGVGPKGTIQRTSSGKPRRRIMWQLDTLGHLDLQHVVAL